MQLLCLCLCLCLLASPVAAHEAQSSTRVVLQVQADATQLLVLYEVGAGTAAQVLRTVHDLDLDGVLDETEQASLARRLSNDALSGLEVSRDGAGLEARDVSWRLELQPAPDGAVLVALLVELEGGGAGRYAVALGAARPELTVELEAGEGLRIARAVSAPAADGIAVGPLVLSEGDALWAELEVSVR